MSIQRFLASIVDPRLKLLAEHWVSNRRGGRLPAWRDVDPAAIVPVLPIVFAWRYDRASGLFRGRLAGEAIIERTGRSPRGALLDDYFPGEGLSRLRACWEEVVLTPCLARIQGSLHRPRHNPGRGERILMPLAGDGIHPDDLIGATAYSSGRDATGDVEDGPTDAAELFPIADP